MKKCQTKQILQKKYKAEWRKAALQLDVSSKDCYLTLVTQRSSEPAPGLGFSTSWPVYILGV